VVADSDATRNGDLLIRLSSTGSFQEVKEQTFTSAQSYNFEFRRADGVGCLVQNVFVSPDDVNNKVLLTLQVTFP